MLIPSILVHRLTLLNVSWSLNVCSLIACSPCYKLSGVGGQGGEPGVRQGHPPHQAARGRRARTHQAGAGDHPYTLLKSSFVPVHFFLKPSNPRV
jgi:hypothetical protein